MKAHPLPTEGHSMITAETAKNIALAYREIDVASKLLEQIVEALKNCTSPDFRDAFGHRRGGLQLGVPSGAGGNTLYDVPWNLAKPIIEAHIGQQRSIIAALCKVARVELDGDKHSP